MIVPSTNQILSFNNTIIDYTSSDSIKNHL